ncbi:hypothetical protein [Maricaulis sp. MIT060901]|uniref:hypothetical protein n=1 Tax=Maricaulis sp. MIT060901 TaxID=3096993 RepID=UPI00399A9ED7
MLTAPPTFSQDTPSAQSSLQIDAGLTIALNDGEKSDVFADLEARFEWENITQEGRRYGFVLAGRAERDPGRAGWGGAAGNCPDGIADCAGDGAGDVLRGVTSGFYAAHSGQSDPLRGALTHAFGYVHMGYGEVRLGYGDGAARLDAVAPPTAFRLSRADNGRVDITGLSGSRTYNYASGQAPKLVLRSIALGQARSIGSFRGSLSYTPEANGCGVDYCDHAPGASGVLSADIENIVEAGLFYELHRGETELSFSLGYASGQSNSAVPVFEDLDVTNAGVRVQRGAWSGGVRWLSSNNATGGDYEALSASIARESGDWLYTLEWSNFGDNTVHADGRSIQIGGSKLIGDHWLAGAGLQYAERREAMISPLGRRHIEQDSTTFFLELGWRY